MKKSKEKFHHNRAIFVMPIEIKKSMMNLKSMRLIVFMNGNR